MDECELMETMFTQRELGRLNHRVLFVTWATDKSTSVDKQLQLGAVTLALRESVIADSIRTEMVFICK